MAEKKIEVSVTAVGAATLVECTACGPVGVSVHSRAYAAQHHLVTFHGSDTVVPV